MKNIVIGTAGHIDHGKTTLIKALTGRETDTLQEEKKRGISINLGFTYFDLPNNKRVGIVDVPGHEKFIKNMLAGASGLDMVMLVISAEEGVMPQTIEHIDILTYLNIKKGIVVLTKSDSVDDEFRELVKEDIISELEGSFLENAQIIEVDSISKRGINDLIKIVDDMTNDIDDMKDNSLARLNIDRAFSVKGFGTVITGTLIEGSISLEDELVIYPKNKMVRIRSIQVHGKNVEKAYKGQRTAINISNVSVDEVERGDILAAKNSLEESMMIDTSISIVKHYEKDLKHWDRLRLYHGTKEILCRAVPLESESISSGNKGYVQLRLEEPIASKNGDKFVIRTFSPMKTIGGGIVIDSAPKKHKRFDSDVIESLKIKEKGNLKDIIEEYLKHDLQKYNIIKDIMIYSGEKEDIILKELNILINENKVVNINNIYIHMNKFNNLSESIIEILTKYHKSNRLKDGISKEELKSRLDSKLKTKDIDKILEITNCNLVTKSKHNMISLNEFNVKLNKRQEEIQVEINSIIRKNGIKDILSISDITKDDRNYKEVVDYMIGKDLEQLDEKHIINKNEYDKLKMNLVKYLTENKEITLGEYRDLSNSSRKNCMILLENFDRNKITKRIENKRILY